MCSSIVCYPSFSERLSVDFFKIETQILMIQSLIMLKLCHFKHNDRLPVT